MSWHDVGGNAVRSSRSRTWSGVRRQEMQVNAVRPTARVVRREDSQHHTTDAVDGIGYGLLSMLNTRVSNR